jgi:hypothetical protein
MPLQIAQNCVPNLTGGMFGSNACGRDLYARYVWSPENVPILGDDALNSELIHINGQKIWGPKTVNYNG